MMSCYERARAGDPAATEAVVEALRPRLVRMAAYYARRSGEDPDDLLQEAWVGLLEALPALDLGIGSPDQYLIQRARWRLLDAVKLFDIIFMMTGGGPGTSTYTASFYLYQIGFQQFHLSQATAGSWLFLALTAAVIAVLVRRLLRAERAA